MVLVPRQNSYQATENLQNKPRTLSSLNLIIHALVMLGLCSFAQASTSANENTQNSLCSNVCSNI